MQGCCSRGSASRRLRRSLDELMMSRLKITEQFATPHHCNTKHTICTPPWLHLISGTALTSCVGAYFPLRSSSHFPTPAASEVALPRHASRLVAGSSAPDIAVACHPHRLTRLVALSPCTMLCICRSSIPPPMPVAARRPLRLPQFLDLAEPAEREGSQGNTGRAR